MESKDPTSIKHLEQWKKDFDFDGKLNSFCICRLIGRIEQKEKDDETFEDFVIRMTQVFKRNSGLVEDNDENGAYKQQLKNAIHGGSSERIKHWVDKHYIGMSGGTLQEYITHALHADKVTKNKKQGKVRDVMYRRGAR